MILQESQSIAWPESQACSARVLLLTFPFAVCVLCLSTMYLPVSQIYCFSQSLQLMEYMAPLWCWKGMGSLRQLRRFLFVTLGLKTLVCYMGPESFEPAQSLLAYKVRQFWVSFGVTLVHLRVQLPSNFFPCSSPAASSSLCFQWPSWGTFVGGVFIICFNSSLLLGWEG